MKKRFMFLVMMMLLLVLVVNGCSSSYDEAAGESAMYADMADGGTYNTTSSTSDSMDFETDEEYVTSEEKSIEDVDGLSTSTSNQTNSDGRKYILTYRYELETLTFDDTHNNLMNLIDANGGYLESTEVSGRNLNGYSSLRRGYYTVRIPKENIGDFLEAIKGVANVVNESGSKEDVTNQYIDLDARIRTLKVQEERLIAILEEADDLEYVIQLERELSDVRYEIESYESTFRNLENRISYSTVYVNLQEVYEPTVEKVEPRTFMEKLSSGFVNSVSDVVDFFENLILFLLTQSPILILIALIFFVIYKLMRMIINRIFGLGKYKTKKDIQENDHLTEKAETINEESKVEKPKK